MAYNRWLFVHHRADGANWTPGLRKIFEYRDFGIEAGTDGDYVNQVTRLRHREIECSDDPEMLEVVSAVNFEIRIVDTPESCRNRARGLIDTVDSPGRTDNSASITGILQPVPTLAKTGSRGMAARFRHWRKPAVGCR